jgi:hypothetical protein
MKYKETSQFSSELKKLSKKFPSLKSDLETAKQYHIELFHFENLDRQGIFKIEKVKNDENIQFFKIKKFTCKSLKGCGANSGIRITYAFSPIKKEITFLEIYFKSQKENEDKKRMEEFQRDLDV